jgi:hypothetical protein
MIDKNSKVTALVKMLEAAADSAKRGRALIFVITFGSIIAFAAAWKALPFSWSQSRVRAVIAAVDYLQDETAKAGNQQARTQIALRRQKMLGLGDNKEAWVEHLKQGEQYVQSHGFVDVPHARTFLDALERERLETVVRVHLPIVGITFDVNDLGMIAGMSFIALMFALRLVLRRELENVKIVFRRARESAMSDYAYELLAMTQVLMIPPRLKSEPASGRFWSRTPMLLIWFPCLVQGMLFVTDASTIRLGASTSEGLTTVTLLIGFATLSILLIMSASCWYIAGLIDHEWAKEGYEWGRPPFSPSAIQKGQIAGTTGA